MGMKIALKACCAIKNTNQNELAVKTGITEGTLSKISTGKTSPKLSTMEIIAINLDMKLSEMITISELVAAGDGGQSCIGTSGISTTKHH